MVFGIAVCLGWLAFDRYFKLHDIAVNMPVLGVLLLSAGFVGTKLDDALLTTLFVRHGEGFLALVANLRSGYTYLGGVLMGSLAGFVYLKVKRIPVLRASDSLFCIGLGYGVGRVGCFLAGDGDYGIASNLPWAVSFPHGVVPTLDRVHPTMLYLSAWEFAVFAVLWRLSIPRHRPPLRPGTLLGCYLIASGCGRFVVEFLSRNAMVAFGLKEAQLVCAVMIAGGLAILGYVFLHQEAKEYGLGPGTSQLESPGL